MADMHNNDSGQTGPDFSYITSLRGVLKISECVATLIAFGCSMAYVFWPDITLGGGWVAFATISACVFSLLFFLFNLLNLNSRISFPLLLIELIYTCIYLVLLLAAAILAAVRTGQLAELFGWPIPAFVIATIFTFVAWLLFAVDTFVLCKERCDNRNLETPSTTTPH